MRHTLAFFTLVIFMFAAAGISVPRFKRTQLPIPNALDPGDDKLLLEAMKLEVYVDSEDPKLFYYLPPIKVRQYANGAAGPFIFATKIDHYNEAQMFLREREALAGETLVPSARQEEAVKRAENELQEVKKMRLQALEKRDDESIRFYDNWITKFEQELEKLRRDIISENQTKKEERLSAWDDRISTRLALMGHDVDISKIEDYRQRIAMIKQTMLEASQSYGGYLGLTVYGGFTEEQLAALRLYKAKYTPDIRIVLMPIEKMGFESLTNTQFDKNIGNTSTKIFGSVKGSGDYLGATAVLDLTVEGGKTLAVHQKPFFVPMAVTATWKNMVEPFDAELVCDNMTGFVSSGRADIREGFLFWNKRVNTIDAKEKSEGGCQLTPYQGDIESAEYEALQVLEKQFDEMHVQRAQLSFAEKELFVQRELDNFQQNQNKAENKNLLKYAPLLALGVPGAVLAGLSYLSGAYWYTSEHNVKNLSNFKFRKRITYNNKITRSIEHGFASDICLVYNLHTKAYDRCNEEELKEAKSLQQANIEIANSDECKNDKDVWECATNRDKAGLLPNRPVLISPSDHRLTDSI